MCKGREINSNSKAIGQENCSIEQKSCSNDKQKKLKKARKKYMSYGIAQGLLQANHRSPLAKSYRNSLYCINALKPTADGTKLTSHYCKNRWCPTCQSIRTAVLINGYLPQLKALEAPHFVTLTRPTVKARGLKAQKEKMLASWRLIRQLTAFRANKWQGLLKRECTIRPDGYYHYHFHLIVSNRACAEFIVKEWLRLNPTSDPKAQKIESIRPGTGAMLELFKYFTKLVGKTGEKRESVIEDPQTHAKRLLIEQERCIDYKNLDIIMRFMRGQRVFQPFGGLKAVEEDFDEANLFADLTQEERDAYWLWQTNDWVNVDTGHPLTGYKPSEKLTILLRDGKSY